MDMDEALAIVEIARQFFSEVRDVDLDEMFASELRDRVDDFRTVIGPVFIRYDKARR